MGQVGIFSPNFAFFWRPKNRQRPINLPFFLKKYGSRRDPSSPYEAKNRILTIRPAKLNHLLGFSWFKNGRILYEISLLALRFVEQECISWVGPLLRVSPPKTGACIVLVVVAVVIVVVSL